MVVSVTKSTIYFDADIHRALRLKAADQRQSISELVNAAVRQSLAEDMEDLDTFEGRVAEPSISYEAVLKDLRSHGKL